MNEDKLKKIDDFFTKRGITFEETFIITRNVPTPEQERAGNVIGGVNTMDEALARIAAIPRPKPKAK